MKPEFAKTLLYEAGEYEMDILELNLNGPVVVFEPMGCNFIGAFGGIALYLSGYKAHKLMLLLMRRDDDTPYWELRKSRLERSLFPKRTDFPTARKSRVSFLNHLFLSCTQHCKTHR